MHRFGQRLHCCAKMFFLYPCAEISNFAAEKIALIQQADHIKQAGTDETDSAGDIICIVERILLQWFFKMGNIMTAYVPAARVQDCAAGRSRMIGPTTPKFGSASIACTKSRKSFSSIRASLFISRTNSCTSLTALRMPTLLPPA